MSTTTQILFNSPALHSLKREQLVKLCKIHTLKANGKNIDLIQRLRQHAQSLPKDAPLSIAARSECEGQVPCKPMETDVRDQDSMQEDEVQSTTCAPRPSEQWEVVMDSIEEVEENSSQGTLSSQRTVNNATSGEFGTGGSAASTVTSSIRALATSLGLRRTMAKLPSESTSSKITANSQIPEDDDLEKNSKRYSTIPLSEAPPQTDHFTLDAGRPSLGGTDESPLPGHLSRPGIPAPPNARLSLGLGIGVPTTPTRKAQPTTTIRLVSNPLSQQGRTSYDEGGSGTPQLKPFQTTFDITFGSPVPGNGFNSGFGGFTSWPPKDIEMTAMRSPLTADVIAPSNSSQGGGADKEAESHTAAPPSPPSSPFIFGSPRHSVSNNQFRDAAVSVLEEMNSRLRADGVDEIGVDIINKLHPVRNSHATQREIKPIPTSKRGEITNRFEEAHQQEFSKMEGINDTFRKRRPQPKELQPESKNEKGTPIAGRKRKSDVLEQENPKRPSVVANRPRVNMTRVISTGRRSKVIPGGFGLDDEDEEAPDDSRAGKRVRTDSDSLTATDEPKRQENERELQLEKEKEAIRKKLEANKARRRSSAAAGRKSLGRNGPRPSVLIKPKPKPSRFGFLASAKSLVQSVWSRGKASTSVPPSHIPKPAPVPAQTEPGYGQPPLPKEEKWKTKMAPPSFVPNRKAALAPAKPTTVLASGNKTTVPSIKPNEVASELTATTQTRASLASTRSSRSRSPLPSFSTLASNSSSSGIALGRSSQANVSRGGSVLGTATSRTSTGISSVGIRFSGLNIGSDSIGNMGSKKTIGGVSGKSSVGTAVSSSSRTMARTSSRLLAPTASSLAKTVSNSATPGNSTIFAGDVGKNEKQKEKTALGSITNNQVWASSHGNEGALLLPARYGVVSKDSGELGEDFSSNVALPKKSAPVKRTLSGRKPRISRSKVIAKLASQRAASGSSVSSTRSSSSGTGALKPRVPASSGRTRSSFGVKVARASYGNRSSSGGDGLALAIGTKRPARRSEYSRRRSSRVVPTEGHLAV